ncbi:MAG: polyprenol monophosphomannose synthase [bacterium]
MEGRSLTRDRGIGGSGDRGPLGSVPPGEAIAFPRSRVPAFPVLSVIVPTYNERDALPALLARLDGVRRTLPLEVVIVDDASPDGTGSMGETLARRTAMPVTIIHRPRKSGLASAAIDGAAAAHGRIVTVMDADLSHPPELLPSLVAAIDAGADVAIASRYVPDGGIDDWPLARRILSVAATALARTVLGLPVRDPLSGFFAARTSLLTGGAYYGVGYKLLVEVLVRHPGRIVEVPYRFTDRRRGHSKLTLAEVRAFFVLLAGLWRYQHRMSRPE